MKVTAQQRGSLVPCLRAHRQGLPSLAAALHRHAGPTLVPRPSQRASWPSIASRQRARCTLALPAGMGWPGSIGLIGSGASSAAASPWRQAPARPGPRSASIGQQPAMILQGPPSQIDAHWLRNLSVPSQVAGAREQPKTSQRHHDHGRLLSGTANASQFTADKGT